jgi:alpha-tubulin suppressor-like RCC1 family protein
MFNGPNNVCALVAGGVVKCWGYNFHGELGNNTTSNDFQPMAQTAIGISGATMVAVGNQHVCALLGDGSVKCWGHNDLGQLGDGSAPVDRKVPGPTVTGLSGVTAIAAGGTDYTCALTSAGALKCWGANDQGQIGGNGLTSVKAIATGAMHACALLSSGQLRCWGRNLEGQLGNGTFTTNSVVPVTVTGW